MTFLTKRPTYDRVIAQFLLRHIRPGSTVIDVGCGTGWTALLLSEEHLGCSVDGVDIDTLDVHRANHLFLQAKRDHLVNCKVCGAENITSRFGRNRYDFVVSNHSLHHYGNQQKALTEIRRALRSSGKLLLTELEQGYGETIDNCPRFQPAKIKTMLQAAGLSNIRYERKRPGVLLFVAHR